MKKILSFTLAILLATLTIGCTANTQTPNENTSNTEVEAPKGTYNVAYVTIPFLTQDQKLYTNPNGESDYVRTINKCSSSNWYYESNVFCYINDYEFGKNDTIILYLTDGRTLQTSTSNVLLMYEPDIE